MATWQFVIVLIPREWAVNAKYDPSGLYRPDGYETEQTWKDSQPCHNFQECLSKILPASKSWSDALLFWGDEKENDIQVGLENDVVLDIQVRIALNTDFKPLIIKLIEAANELDCVLFFPELHLISNATETELIESILRSSASRFVNNPREYLNDLPNKI